MFPPVDLASHRVTGFLCDILEELVVFHPSDDLFNPVMAWVSRVRFNSMFCETLGREQPSLLADGNSSTLLSIRVG